jgi:formylglycine-generating enzyme required for sulfatase activity
MTTSTLMTTLTATPIPQIHWREIPSGQVTLLAGGHLPAPTTFYVESFAIATYPVTNEQFAAFVEAGGYSHPQWWTEHGRALRNKGGWTAPHHWTNREWNQPEQPVVGVSWYEALAYCRWLSELIGQTVTLPSEQQWQRAAQGDDGRFYPWGNEDPNETLCNWQRNIDGTTSVTGYPDGASPYGVMDLCGNVWEWCLTAAETGSNDSTGVEARMVRGGAWSSDSPLSLRITNRSGRDPNTRLRPGERHHATVGFRCVQSTSPA